MATLFPNLPPELRTEIYTYLTNTTPTTQGLPIKPKTYTNKHTTIQIAACHHGSVPLLSSEFHESSEYTTWLLNNGLHLKIGVHFYGRVQTFVQADWDRKVEAHLRKLGRLFPFLRKVAEYEVCVRWEPKDGGVSTGKKRKSVAGGIVAGMVRTVTTVLGDEDVRLKRGYVDVKVRFAHGVGVEMMFMGARSGAGEVLSARNGFGRGKVEVCLEKRVKKDVVEIGKRFLACPNEQEERVLLLFEKDIVVWNFEEEQILIRDQWEDGRLLDVRGEEPEEVILARLKECLR